MDTDIITTKEAARLMGISPVRVTKLCREGRIPGARLLGGHWLFDRQTIAEHERELRQPGRPRKQAVAS